MVVRIELATSAKNHDICTSRTWSRLVDIKLYIYNALKCLTYSIHIKIRCAPTFSLIFESKVAMSVFRLSEGTYILVAHHFGRRT